MESGIDTKSTNSQNVAVAITLSKATDIEADEFSKICDFMNSKKWVWLGCQEAGEKNGKLHCHFGVVAPFSNVGNFGKAFKPFLLKNFDGYNTAYAVKLCQWYVGGPDFEVKHPVKGRACTHSTWEDYLEKDGAPRKSPSFPENWDDIREDFLAPNVAPKDQKDPPPVWGSMVRFVKLFEEHELPSATIDDIETGLCDLAFNKKVIVMPERRKVSDLVYYMHMFVNGCEGNGLAQMRELDMQNMLVKRRRVAQMDWDMKREKMHEVNALPDPDCFKISLRGKKRCLE
ncbi:MAG: putative replicase [Cressdnaviricota sp.]|nr:MAG: putative replicase [Cressdnaviricota sp.]